MKEFRIRAIILMLITYHSIAYTQSGTIYLQNYEQAKLPSKSLSNALVHTANGDIIVANNQGALHYNGNQWQTIATKSTLYALLDDSTTIYAAGRSDFGYFRMQSTGKYLYTSLATASKDLPKQLGDFRTIKSTNNYIYFLSSQTLVQVSRKNQKITQVLKGNNFQALITFKEFVLVNIKGKGMYRLAGKSLNPMSKTSQFRNLSVQSSFTIGGIPWITANDNKLYVFDGEGWQVAKLSNQQYLNENTLTKGVALSNNRIALGTLNGGVLVINWKSGETLHTINHQTGLPDDEVIALSANSGQDLWIIHAQGITQAKLDLPIKNFTQYPGLIGSLNAAVYWKNQLYVATSEGLFQLNKTQSFQDLVTPIRNQQQATLGVSSSGGTVVGNLINDVFGKRKQTVQIAPKQPLKNRNVLARQDYALRSFPYYFKKVGTLSFKINQLLPVANALLIASNQGLYALEGGVTKPIFEGGEVHQIRQSPKYKNRVYAGTSKGLKNLVFQSGNWVLKIGFESIKSPIYSMAFLKSELWLGSDNQVFKVNLDDNGQYQKHRLYPLTRNYLEQVQVVSLAQKPVLFLSGGVYRLATKSQQFYRDSTSKSNTPVYQLIQRQQYAWSNIYNDWNNLKDSSKATYLSLFDQVSDVFEDPRKDVWVTHRSGVHKITPAQVKDSTQFRVLLSRVYDHQNQHLPLDRIRLYQGAKAYSIHFVLGTSSYINEQTTLYRYRIDELTKGWSNWSTKAQLDFTFLPSGNHTLEVQAKNSLGQMSHIRKIDFRVVPPFWKRWWFYLLEILVLAGLVFAAAVSNRFTKYQRYASIITFVTIITIFEYIVLSIEPTVDNFSGGVPLFKLLMNILLAMSLNPLERRFSAWLSKRSSKNTTVKGR